MNNVKQPNLTPPSPITPLMKGTHIYKCNTCNSFGYVTPASPNQIDISYTYHKCICGEVVQCNPLHAIDISKHINVLDLSLIQNWDTFNANDIVFDLDLLTLEAPESFTDYLPYFEELFNLGDEYVLLDLLNVHNMVEFETTPNDFDLYVIKYKNIHLGIIGLEHYFKDPSSVWMSWTITLPTFRSKGLGGKAFELLVEKLKADGVKRIYVDADERPGTIKFYNTLNFETVGTCKQFRKANPVYTKKFLMYDNDIVMFKNL